MTDLTLAADETTAAALIEALNNLDPSNEAHWTDDGRPEMDDVNSATGVLLLREELDLLTNGFSRQRAAEGWCVVALAPEGGEATLKLREGLTGPLPSGQGDEMPEAEDQPQASARHANDPAFRDELCDHCSAIETLMANRKGLTGPMKTLSQAAGNAKREITDA